MRKLKKVFALLIALIFTSVGLSFIEVEAEHYDVKVLIVGEPGVGKKSLARRLRNGSIFGKREIDHTMFRNVTPYAEIEEKEGQFTYFNVSTDSCYNPDLTEEPKYICNGNVIRL